MAGVAFMTKCNTLRSWVLKG